MSDQEKLIEQLKEKISGDIRYWREKMNLTRYQMAKHTGYSHVNFKMWEEGTRVPSALIYLHLKAMYEEIGDQTQETIWEEEDRLAQKA